MTNDRRGAAHQRQAVVTASEVVFADLFAYAGGALGYLRVYRRNSGVAIALVFAPTDNPGKSPVNAAEQLHADLQRAFGELQVFVSFADAPHQEYWTQLVFADQHVTSFSHHSTREIERLVGEPVTLPAPHDATCARLGGADHSLLALLKEPEPDRNPIDDLAVVAVADLPWAHRPARCAHAGRFEQIEALYPPDSGARTAAIGAHWFFTLTDVDLASCSYHRADWSRIADVAVAVYRALTPGAQPATALTAVGEAIGDPCERAWCESLFSDPIVWYPGAPNVVNGQHRTCALRASGAGLCVVDVEGRHIGEPIISEPRRRAAGEIAAYWTRTASG